MGTLFIGPWWDEPRYPMDVTPIDVIVMYFNNLGHHQCHKKMFSCVNVSSQKWGVQTCAEYKTTVKSNFKENIFLQIYFKDKIHIDHMQIDMWNESASLLKDRRNNTIHVSST